MWLHRSSIRFAGPTGLVQQGQQLRYQLLAIASAASSTTYANDELSCAGNGRKARRNVRASPPSRRRIDF